MSIHKQKNGVLKVNEIFEKRMENSLVNGFTDTERPLLFVVDEIPRLSFIIKQEGK